MPGGNPRKIYPLNSPANEHRLIVRRKGTNGVSGYYMCSCSESFTGARQYELHRSIARKAEKIEKD